MVTIIICSNSLFDYLILIFSNCNHFSNDLCKIIVGKEIPAYVNRCAKVASWFSGIANAVADHMNVVSPSGGEGLKGTLPRGQSSSQHDCEQSNSHEYEQRESGAERETTVRRSYHPTRKH